MMIGVLSYFCFLLNSINLRNSSLFARLAETYFSLMKKGVAGILSSESMCSNPLSFNPSLLDESISAEKAFGNLNYLCHKFKSDELDISNSSCFVMKMSSEAKDLTVLVVICELVLRWTLRVETSETPKDKSKRKDGVEDKEDIDGLLTDISNEKGSKFIICYLRDFKSLRLRYHNEGRLVFTQVLKMIFNSQPTS